MQIDDEPRNEAFAGAWMLYRLIFGPLAWPVVVANAAGLVWCYWQVF
jgi:hypothetical protein